MSRTGEPRTRREFFAGLLRYLALGALAGGSVFLMSRRRRHCPFARPEVSDDPACGKCSRDNCPARNEPRERSRGNTDAK